MAIFYRAPVVATTVSDVLPDGGSIQHSLPEEEVAEVSSDHNKASTPDSDCTSLGGKTSVGGKPTSLGSICAGNKPPTPSERVLMTAAPTSYFSDSLSRILEDFTTREYFGGTNEKLQSVNPVVTAIPVTTEEDAPKTSATSIIRRGSLFASSLARTSSRQRKPPRGREDTAQTDRALAITGNSIASSRGSPERDPKPFRRRDSWMSSSKSKAPSSPERPGRHHQSPSCDDQRPSVSPLASEGSRTNPASVIGSGLLPLPPMKPDVAQKRSRLSGFFNDVSVISKASQEERRPPSQASHARSFSMDRLPGLKGSLPSLDRISSFSSKQSFDKLVSSRPDPVRKRDELWSTFRSLESDFERFSGKSLSVKVTIVRASLLPFLRAHVDDTVDKLRAEDLEKRISILHRWWAGVIAILNGQSGQSTQLMLGSDRPVVLDALCSLMERPEWRAPWKVHEPDVGHTPLSRHSSTSAGSDSSDFVTAAVHHNIRNTYIQNLLSQMGVVVDKMSLKSTPAGVVAFCGKTCAYAFLFCPGAAAFLTSLWQLPMDPMRRILQKYGVPRHSVMGDVSDRVASRFPPHLGELGFVSLTETLRNMRKHVLPPLGTDQYRWHGPWVNKWFGKESDLFYSFVKHYHILLMEFLPIGFSKLERLCAPGLLLVHAQLLINLDATIRRNDADYPRAVTLSTFDDLLLNPDSSAPPLPLAPTNATRLMAENRIVLLLRDCLSERTSKNEDVRHFSAECLNDLVQAAAKGTSLFNQNACCTLCDFLEEALPIFLRYDNARQTGQTIIDWSFWFEVWRKMVKSQNTTTEIRLYSLLYSMWAPITEQHARKVDLCVGLLLDQDIFLTRFNHWCPMVRGYYMRLLCWRVARYDDGSLSSDITILTKLMECLGMTWSYFRYSRLGPGIDTPQNLMATPCPPAPGRRLLIVRVDPALDTHGGSLTLERAAASSGVVSRAGGSSWVNPWATGDWRPGSADSSDSAEQDENTSTRWGLLRNVMKGATRAKSQSPKPMTRNGDGGRTSPVKSDPTRFFGPREHSRQRSGSMPATARHRSFSFKFSLEFVDRRFEAPSSILLGPPQLPRPAQEYLMSQFDMTAMFNDICPTKPCGQGASISTYVGRALAEWAIVVHECQSFFERRIREGVPSHILVETPMLGVETFRRPG